MVVGFKKNDLGSMADKRILCLRGHDCPPHRTKGHEGLNWGWLNMICICIMRNYDRLWEKEERREKTFYKNHLEFWPFYPPRSNPDPMANSHLNSMVNKLTVRVHTPFSQTSKAFRMFELHRNVRTFLSTWPFQVLQMAQNQHSPWFPDYIHWLLVESVSVTKSVDIPS